MADPTVTETTLTRGSSDASVGLTDKSTTRTFDVQYDAESPPSSLVAVASATGLPALRATHTDDSSLYVTKRSAKPRGDGLLFEVTVEYENTISTFPTDNPLDEPDKIEWGGSEGTEPYFRDKSSTPKPCVNTAGQPFDPFLQREVTTFIVTVTRNVASPPSGILTYVDKVNSDSVTIDGVTFSAGQVKMGLITISAAQVRNGTAYREIKFPMKLRASWDDVVDSYGFQELVSSKLQPIKDPVTGENVQKPWPLATNGTKKTNSTDTPDQVTLKPYDTMAYSSLSFT